MYLYDIIFILLFFIFNIVDLHSNVATRRNIQCADKKCDR